MACVRRLTRPVLFVAIVAGLILALLLSFGRPGGHARATPSRPERAAPEPVPASAAGGAAVAPGDGDSVASPAREAEGADPPAEGARERLLAWAFDAGGMVCCETPERYLKDLWNVRFHRERSQVADGPVTGVYGPKVRADEWLAAMPRDVALHAVDLRYSDVSARGLDLLAGREDVRVLILLGCTHLRVEDLGVVAMLPALEILVVRGADLDDRALALVGGATRLRRLELSGMGITDAGVPHLLGLARLERLHLGHTGVSRASLPSLARMPSLGRLNLPNVAIVDRAALDAAR